MKRTTSLLGVTVPFLIALALLLAKGQEPPSIRVEVELVNLFVTVRDGQRRIVRDLEQRDFRVFEDGREQQIEFFSRETSLPITLGLLIDTSGSQRNLLAAEQAAAMRFLEKVLRVKDEAMVVTFDVEVDLLNDFTGDRATLERAVRRARIRLPEATNSGPPGSAPGTTLYDAIYLTCKDRMAGRSGRKALVILTDAEDVGSKVSLRQALEMAQRTDTVLHIILLSQRIGYSFGKKAERVARRLAQETGGRVVRAARAEEFDAAFAPIAEELRSQYLLSYTPSNRARDGRWRKLRVETSRQHLQVLTRKGYYAGRR